MLSLRIFALIPLLYLLNGEFALMDEKHKPLIAEKATNKTSLFYYEII